MAESRKVRSTSGTSPLSRTGKMVLLRSLVIALLLCYHGSSAQNNRNRYRRGSQCYDANGLAQRCMPPFVNAAFPKYENVPRVEATNTCGLYGEQGYCLQTGVTGATKSCDVCNARDPSKEHPPRFLTDFHDRAKLTWWQSETMLEGVQYPETVNLTLHLGKSFDITYVRLKFHSSRPESFAIFKRTVEDSDWIPYQYYSGSCLDTYNKRNQELIDPNNEAIAICTNEYSDISPLTGGSVAFSTLEGRPSAYNFENSPALQGWVTATDIRVVLTRMNTFGDEVFGDPNVLKSYFYAISDFAVGGRCKCNGHASECILATDQTLENRLICKCEHNTKGPDCGECGDYYNDRPWKRATPVDAHECIECDCNGLSRKCYFDQDLYDQTGHGGHCYDCRENTAGIHCELCKENFFRRSEFDWCEDCLCDPVGSESLQCDTSGRCTCKPGVTGEKCDRCLPNFFDLGPDGCRPCACEIAGSRDNNPVCMPNTGICTCKELVEGQNCDACKPGYFNLDEDNEYGCISCFCYGHSSDCISAAGFGHRTIHSNFNSGTQRWKGTDMDGNDIPINYSAFDENVALEAPSVHAVYFQAPDRFLGDQRYSYGQPLEFHLRLREDEAQISYDDLIIEGDGRKISTPIYSQGNPVPSTEEQTFKFILNEHTDYRWNPQLTAFEFIRMLSNLTAIKIRATYKEGGEGFLDTVKLHSAVADSGSREVTHIEQCTCPEGYVGQFCESCQPGYRRDPPYGGPLSRCVPCNCNGHSDACDVNSGACICQHNTAGDNCERCASGYYGYALAGTPDDCTKCPCPNDGECVELLDMEVICINCGEGYTGPRCELCSDGYFGDPEGRYGIPRPCTKCICNDNIDPNAVANCNTTTGECLKCIYNTGNDECGTCLPGYYGDALKLPKGDCKACNCYKPGSVQTALDVVTCTMENGQCPCLPNVINRQCDMCVDGYWNIDSGFGCEACRCDDIGSFNNTCDIYNGQCLCRPGITGRTCDQCAVEHFGFSSEGCEECACDPEGSYETECNEIDGQCACKPNIEGRQCDRCEENKFNITAGCIDCPACYNLVQDRIRVHREKLEDLRELIENIDNNPGAIDDADFRRRMTAVNDSVNELLDDARKAIGSDGPLSDQLKMIEDSIKKLMEDCGRIARNGDAVYVAWGEAAFDVSDAEAAIMEAEEALHEAEQYLLTEGQAALQKARDAQVKFGQQSERMTDIARQAREEAERQEEEAMRIEDTANKALNTSQEALSIAREALRKPMETDGEIRELKRQVQDTDETMYGQTQLMADRALRQATEAYDDALGISIETDRLQVPTVDVEELENTASAIKTEAGQIKEQADNLIEQHRALMDDVDEQKFDAEELLEDGYRQQQIAAELLAEANSAKGIAEDAILKAEKTLQEADDTLQTLKEFDEKVQQSKDAAEDALTRVRDIEDKILEAEQLTREAQDNLAGAEADAIGARDIAQDAQNLAEMASDEADQIREEASQTRTNAEQLKRDAAELEENVNDGEQELIIKEEQAETDKDLAREALTKADEAKRSAAESSANVHEALQTVEDILRKLVGLENSDSNIDTAKLDELEESLDTAEQRLTDANLDERYNALREAQDKQQQWVLDYTNELIKLRQDVEEIRAINETIPRECFRGLILEQTDPTG